MDDLKNIHIISFPWGVGGNHIRWLLFLDKSMHNPYTNGQEIDDKMHFIKCAQMYCSNVYQPYWDMDENLFNSRQEMLQQKCRAEEKESAPLRENEKNIIQEMENLYQLMIEHSYAFQYHLCSFSNCIMQLADSIDPNHDMEL